LLYPWIRYNRDRYNRIRLNIERRKFDEAFLKTIWQIQITNKYYYLKFKIDDFCIELLFQGPIHTRYFCTQYCDKKITSSHMFQIPTKVSFEKTYLYLFFVYVPWFFKGLPWPIEIHGTKIYFYRNIFLSQYCVRKCLVCISPKTEKIVKFSLSIK